MTGRELHTVVPLLFEKFTSLFYSPIYNAICRGIEIFRDEIGNETRVGGHNLRRFDNGAASGADRSNKRLKR